MIGFLSASTELRAQVLQIESARAAIAIAGNGSAEPVNAKVPTAGQYPDDPFAQG